MATRPRTRGSAGSRAAAATTASKDVPLSPIRSPQVLDGLGRTLLEVGRRTFVELGYHRASVAKIAEEAGASIGLLYYHFTNKEGLYRAVWVDYQQLQLRSASQAVKLVRSAGVEDGPTLFLAGTRAYLSNCWDNRDIVLMALVGDLPPGFVIQTQAVSRSWVEMNTTLLGVGDGVFAQALVEMSAQAIGGAAKLVAGCESREAADEAANAAISVLRCMLTASGGAAVDAGSGPAPTSTGRGDGDDQRYPTFRSATTADRAGPGGAPRSS